MTGRIDYDALSALAEAGELHPALNGPARAGAAAAAYGRAVLRAATGAGTDADALHLALGRPRLDREDDAVSSASTSPNSTSSAAP